MPPEDSDVARHGHATPTPAPMTCVRRESMTEAVQRRRVASLRLPRLDCGCRDPWPHTCLERPPSRRMVDAYLDAVLHLRACGLLAAPNIPAMQALWRRGGDERRLVSEIAAQWELAA